MSTKQATALLAGPLAKSPFPKQTASAEHRLAGDVTRNEMSISVNRVLLTLALAFLLTNGLLWAFVRYWLFAP